MGPLGLRLMIEGRGLISETKKVFLTLKEISETNKFFVPLKKFLSPKRFFDTEKPKNISETKTFF